MVDTRVLLSNMKHPSHECLMTFWTLTSYSYFQTDPTSHQFGYLDTEFDLHRNTNGFHGAFATDVACQQETLTLPDIWFCTLFWDLLIPTVEISFPELAVSFSPWMILYFLDFAFYHYPLLVDNFSRRYLSGSNYIWITKKVNTEVAETSPTIKRSQTAMLPDTGMAA